MKPTTWFAASFVSVVVAGWNHLDASEPEDGPAAAPALREVTIDGHPLRVGVDHARVAAGAVVHATIAMTDAPAAGLDVQVRVLQQTGSAMSRIQSPPREVSSQRVHVGAAATVVPITLAGIVGAAGADPLATAGAATQYTIVVTSTRANDPGAGAYLPVFAYQPEAYRLTIEPPGPGQVGDAVEVAVRVKSLAATPLKDLTIGLGTSFLTVADSPVIAELAPGAETVVRIKATRIAPPDGPLFLQATGWAAYGGSASAWLTLAKDSGAVEGGASEPYPLISLGGF